MENEGLKVRYLGVVTRRPEPMIIPKDRYEELLSIERECVKLRSKVKELEEYKFMYESVSK